MRKKYLVLARSDFGRPITLSHSTDLVDCEAEGDNTASECAEDLGGEEPVYLFELKRVYITRPKEPTKEVETVYVD